MKPPLSISRRHCLITLSTLAVAACATKGPEQMGPPQPRQRPQSLVVLPIDPYDEVWLYIKENQRSFFGGVGRLFAKKQDRAWGENFNKLLQRSGFSPAMDLRTEFIKKLSPRVTSLSNVDDQAAAVKAINEWKFEQFATDGEAIIHLTLEEVAFSAGSDGIIRPKLYVGMSVTSTRDNEELGGTVYQVLEDLDTADPRSMKPLRSSRFESGTELFADSAKATSIVSRELSRLVDMAVRDVITVQEGIEPQWEQVLSNETLEDLKQNPA